MVWDMLNLHMHDFVRGRYVDGLTDNVEYEALEEEVPLKDLG